MGLVLPSLEGLLKTFPLGAYLPTDNPREIFLLHTHRQSSYFPEIFPPLTQEVCLLVDSGQSFRVSILR
jgi:hypothetical protein